MRKEPVGDGISIEKLSHMFSFHVLMRPHILIRESVHPSVCLSAHMSVRPSIRPSMRSSIRPSVCETAENGDTSLVLHSS